MKNIYCFFCLVGLSFFLSCKTNKEALNLKEKMAFYTLSAIKDTIKHSISFKVTKVQIIDQVLNKRLDENQSHNPYYLSIQLIDKQKNSFQVFTEHPLYKRFDLYEESGEIQSKSISLQQGEVTFRVPYYTDYKKIKINETVNFKKQKTITLKK